LLLASLACVQPVAARGADLQPDLGTLAGVPQHALPRAAVQQALAEPPRKERPYRYAVGVDVALSTAQGQWQTLGAARAWRLRLSSADARSLSAHLWPLELPAGARLWVYGADAAEVYGPYTRANVSPRGLWTPVVAGSEMVLEVRLPAGAEAALELQVAQAYHGYRDWWKATVGAGDSGNCNVNVACPEGEGWRAEARSVALITIGNQFVCSGQIVNNTRQDRAPLFLTADHCSINGDAGPADSVNFYFNYEAASCNARPRDPVDNPIAGSTFLAHDAQSDFALLRANGPLPANVYFAGWNALGQGSASGASIHHPSGDEKKISLYTAPLNASTADIGTGCPIDSWEVQWSTGTTEPGSSGAGLWNAARQIIGLLSGGTASCTNPGGLDYYGRLDRAWTANAAREGQLKAHLDPDGTCVAVVPGLDPAVNPNPGPVPATGANTRCEGPASSCSAGGKSGGGAANPALLAGLLVALALRRRRR
jgi:MYXO-CTERM domain-containing protein